MGVFVKEAAQSTEGKPSKRRARMLRHATVVGILCLYAVGLALNVGLGSLSAFGIGDIAAVCPLGSLETMIAGRILLPLPLVALLAAVVVAVLAGRAFCGWICPVPLVRKLVTNKGENDSFATKRRGMRRGDCEGGFAKKRGWPGVGKGSTSALGVLGVTLVTTAVFGFPVFCVVCPMGLVFATIFAAVRLVLYNELVIDLVVFPALIVLELVALRTWCARLCPIGALFGLFARFNRTLQPRVNTSKCLVTTKGLHCDACYGACCSDIDLVASAGTGALHDCTRCKECSSHCPVDAISFPLYRAKPSAEGSTCDIETPV